MWFRQWVSLVTLGRTMNSSHLAKHKATQLSRTQPHANFSEIKQNLAGKDEWLLGMLTLVHRTRPSNLTRISVPYLEHHTPPQLSPSEEGHGNSTPDGCTRLQGKRNLVDIIIWHMWNRTFWLAPYSKTKCQTTYTEETGHTTNHLTKQITKQQQ